MTDTNIRELTKEEDWNEAVPIVRQLWSHVPEEFVRSWRVEEDYHLFGLEAEGELVTVAGVSIQRVMHHERHAWLHDLVVDEPSRGSGYGSELLAFVEQWARERDCEHVSLAARLGKEGARSFYEANDYETWGYVLEREL